MRIGNTVVVEPTVTVLLVGKTAAKNPIEDSHRLQNGVFYLKLKPGITVPGSAPNCHARATAHFFNGFLELAV